MDVFDQWETTTAKGPRATGTSSSTLRGGLPASSRGGGGAVASSPDSSPNRIHAAARRRGRGSQGSGADLGQALEYPSDIFSLRRIDLTAALASVPPSSGGTPRLGGGAKQRRSIQYAVVQSGKLVLALSDATLVRWGLDGTREPEGVALPVTPPRGGEAGFIYKLFLDPTGNHLVISTTAAEHFYLHARASKPRKLTKWQGLVVEAIAFDKALGSEASTRSILLGTDQGRLYETVLEWNPGGAGSGSGSSSGLGGSSSDKEKPLTKVYELEQPLCLRSLEFETVATTDALTGSPSRQLLVLAATANPVRLYKFLGGPTFEALFAKHREQGNLSFQDFGGSPLFHAAELHLFRSERGGGGLRPAESMALLTEAGIYHGKLNLYPPPSSPDAIITEASLTEYIGSDGKPLGDPHHLLSSSPYSAGGGGRRGSGAGGGSGSDARPLSLALSEFHFLLLYPKRLQVVSRLSGKQVQHNPLDGDETVGGKQHCLVYDAAHGTYWLVSEQALYQVSLLKEEEDRFVWRLYLEKALASGGKGGGGIADPKKFDLAYKHCKDAQVHLFYPPTHPPILFFLFIYPPTYTHRPAPLWMGRKPPTISSKGSTNWRRVSTPSSRTTGGRRKEEEEEEEEEGWVGTWRVAALKKSR